MNSLNQNVDCPCCILKGAIDYREINGHYVALDPAFITDNKIRLSINMGSKYRLTHHPNGSIAAIKEAIHHFIHTYDSTYSAQSCLKWAEAIMTKVTENILLAELQPYYTRRFTQTETTKLKELQDYIVFTPIDKAGHNIAATCKLLYQYILSNELYTTNTYKLWKFQKMKL